MAITNAVTTDNMFMINMSNSLSVLHVISSLLAAILRITRHSKSKSPKPFGQGLFAAIPAKELDVLTSFYPSSPQNREFSENR